MSVPEPGSPPGDRPPHGPGPHLAPSESPPTEIEPEAAIALAGAVHAAVTERCGEDDGAAPP